MNRAGKVFLIMAASMFFTAGCNDYNNTVRGDLNDDGHLTDHDIRLLEEWIQNGSDDAAGDLNGDGKVDEKDLDLLESWVCDANGAEIDSNGNCCIVSNDDTACCDRDFDGDFEDCEQPDIDCETIADCNELNCPAVCLDGKCRCQGTCDSDEDCIFLNCPAFCNDNGICECKVTCEIDDDCGFISRCPSGPAVCGDEDYCVCSDYCVGNGEQFNGDPEQHRCCPGLEPITFAEYSGGECSYINCLCYVCADCGNGQCGPGENPCNCAEDCGECIPGDERKHRCPNGDLVPWCTCTDEATWECVGNPGWQCEGDCQPEDAHFQDFEGNQVCCEGLTKADDCEPTFDNDQPGCDCPQCPCFVCVRCGDGQCGPGENHCTCPDDCEPAECRTGDVRYFECPDGSQVPECECDENGRWICIGNPWWQCEENCHPAGDHFQDPTGGERCCEGLTKVEEVSFGGVVSGEPICELICVGGGAPCFTCVPCGDEFCSQLENPCSCPEDCPLPECNPGDTRPCECDNNLVGAPPCFECFDGRWAPIAYEADPCLCWSGPHGGCIEGFVCDPESGLCLPDTCLGEGEEFEAQSPDGRCCPGLTPIPLMIAENGFCSSPNCPCWVCARCGNGQCGPGENRCNCAADCVGAENCTAPECMFVARPYFVSGDCPGIPPGSYEMHDVVQGQQVCLVHFEGLLNELLGPKGCMDHNILFTERGCSGVASQMMASITMHFICPFPNEDQTSETCTVFLDDGLD